MILTPSQITASSWYRQGEPEWDAKTGPENLLRADDGGPHGWLSGIHDVYDPEIYLIFERPVVIRRIGVANGWYERDGASDWGLHGRAEMVKWGTLDRHECATLADVRGVQWFAFTGPPTTHFRVRIKSVVEARFNVVGLGRLRVEGEWTA